MAKHALIRLKRFISPCTSKLCNSFCYLTTFSTPYTCPKGEAPISRWKFLVTQRALKLKVAVVLFILSRMGRAGSQEWTPKSCQGSGVGSLVLATALYWGLAVCPIVSSPRLPNCMWSLPKCQEEYSRLGAFFFFKKRHGVHLVVGCKSLLLSPGTILFAFVTV